LWPDALALSALAIDLPDSNGGRLRPPSLLRLRLVIAAGMLSAERLRVGKRVGRVRRRRRLPHLGSRRRRRSKRVDRVVEHVLEVGRRADRADPDDGGTCPPSGRPARR